MGAMLFQLSFCVSKSNHSVCWMEGQEGHNVSFLLWHCCTNSSMKCTRVIKWPIFIHTKSRQFTWYKWLLTLQCCTQQSKLPCRHLIERWLRNTVIWLGLRSLWDTSTFIIKRFLITGLHLDFIFRRQNTLVRKGLNCKEVQHGKPYTPRPALHGVFATFRHEYRWHQT